MSRSRGPIRRIPIAAVLSLGLLCLISSACDKPPVEEAENPDYRAMLGETSSQRAELLKFHAELQAFAEALVKRDLAMRKALEASSNDHQKQLVAGLRAQRQQFEMFLESYQRWQQEARDATPPPDPPTPPLPPPLPPSVEEELPPESKALLEEAEADLLKTGIAITAAAGCIGFVAACPWIVLTAELLSAIVGGLSYEGAAELLTTVSAPEIVERLPEILKEYPETAPFVQALLKNSPHFMHIDPGTRERLSQLAQKHATEGIEGEDLEYLRKRYSQPISNFDCEGVQLDLSRFPDHERRLAYWLNDLYGQEVLGDGETIEECLTEWIQ